MAFLTEQQIVDDLINRMDDEARKSWQDISKDDLFLGHHTTGRAIRNDYKLWDEDNPLTKPENGKDYKVENSLVVDKNFPDQVSMRIMEAVWETLNTRA